MDQVTLADLIDGKLPWHQLKEVLSGNKDIDRFDLYIEVLQSRVSFKETILLPLGEHLYVVVDSSGRRIVKCDCGHEFGPVEQNWKCASAVLVRDTAELLEEIYDPWNRCDPSWEELREFYCPGCWSLLEVEAAPPGYPVMFDFQPDIDTFYQEYLGRPVPRS